jgi:DNA-binding CsgD family transcriptional regulator
MNYFDFFNFIERSNKALTNEELFSIFKETLLSLGYKQVTYNIITDHISLGLKGQYGIMKECPDDWFDYYFDKGYQHIDPRFQFGFAYKTTFLWNQIENFLDLSKKEKKILNELDDMHYHNGIVVPIFGVTGEISALTISRDFKDTDPNSNVLSLIHAVANQFHLSYLHLNRNKQLYSGIKWHLTFREKEILQWCAHGKGNWEISKILSISENGIEYHLKNIYRKMGVNNRFSAVINAVKSGFITL